MLLQALTSRNSILLIVLLAVTISYSACNSAQVPTGVGPQVVAPSPPGDDKNELISPVCDNTAMLNPSPCDKKPMLMGKLDHVCLIILENRNFDQTFGRGSRNNKGLAKLASEGKLLTLYYGIGHNSLDNYIALISGQPPNPMTQLDCPYFANFKPLPCKTEHGTLSTKADLILREAAPKFTRFLGDDGNKLAKLVKDRSNRCDTTYDVKPGIGCVYPTSVRTIADKESSLTWRAYMEDMNNACQHPMPLGWNPASWRPDPTFSKQNKNYATRHNPFAYFHSLIDDAHKYHTGSICEQNERSLGDLTGTQPGLALDLKREDTTLPSFIFITPNLCNDGHNPACDMQMNDFVPKLVDVIEKSKAYKNSAIIITFDEAEVPPRFPLPSADDEDTKGNANDFANYCCNENKNPGPLWRPGIWGGGGGQVGAIVISPFVNKNTKDCEHPFNHYSLLKSIEDMFNVHRENETTVKYLGYSAGDGISTLQACGVFDAL